MNAAVKKPPTYSPSYVGAILRACVKQHEEKGVFQGALTGPSRFVQRRIPTGQQVFDTQERVNVELQTDKAIIYLPWPHSAEVAAAAAESLGTFTGGVFEMTPQGDAEGMADIHSGRSQAAGSDREYALAVWRAPVPGPQRGAPDRDGVHIMLSIPKPRGSA
ncbi:MAG: hypothetical protein AAFN79_16445 [Pseudomonadota bacterium]